jgi:hypothetical protein
MRVRIWSERLDVIWKSRRCVPNGPKLFENSMRRIPVHSNNCRDYRNTSGRIGNGDSKPYREVICDKTYHENTTTHQCECPDS